MKTLKEQLEAIVREMMISNYLKAVRIIGSGEINVPEKDYKVICELVDKYDTLLEVEGEVTTKF